MDSLGLAVSSSLLLFAVFKDTIQNSNDTRSTHIVRAHWHCDLYARLWGRDGAYADESTKIHEMPLVLS